MLCWKLQIKKKEIIRLLLEKNFNPTEIEIYNLHSCSKEQNSTKQLNRATSLAGKSLTTIVQKLDRPWEDGFEC